MTFVDALKQPKDIQRKKFSSETCYLVGTPDYSVVVQFLWLYFMSNIFKRDCVQDVVRLAAPPVTSGSWYLKAVAESTCLMLT